MPEAKERMHHLFCLPLLKSALYLPYAIWNQKVVHLEYGVGPPRFTLFTLTALWHPSSKTCTVVRTDGLIVIATLARQKKLEGPSISEKTMQQHCKTETLYLHMLITGCDQLWVRSHLDRFGPVP
jgi:hypothetical protein